MWTVHCRSLLGASPSEHCASSHGWWQSGQQHRQPQDQQPQPQPQQDGSVSKSDLSRRMAVGCVTPWYCQSSYLLSAAYILPCLRLSTARSRLQFTLRAQQSIARRHMPLRGQVHHKVYLPVNAL